MGYLLYCSSYSYYYYIHTQPEKRGTNANPRSVRIGRSTMAWPDPTTGKYAVERRPESSKQRNALVYVAFFHSPFLTILDQKKRA